MDTQELLASHMSGVQNCVVFSCQEIKPYGRPYARLTFLYVLLTATHVCMASLTLCLRQRYASPLWSHVLCCCKIPFSFHMIVLMQTVWFPACTLPFPWFQLSERKLLQICLGPAVMKVQWTNSASGSLTALFKSAHPYGKPYGHLTTSAKITVLTDFSPVPD